MADDILYSEADAEFDSRLVFQEVEDLDPLTWMGNVLLCGRDSGEMDNQIGSTVHKHFENVRFSKFSQEALRAECLNIQNKYNGTSNVVAETSTCPSPETYKAKVCEKGMICAVDIPNVGQMISDAGSVRVEASMKQLKKDIERDRLLVNGIRIVGAESGLDSVLHKICDICDSVHRECGVPMLGTEAKEYTVLSLLNKASRSHSGGIAYQAAQALIDPSVAMLVPQSAVTPPLKINIHLGAFPEHCRVRVDQYDTKSTKAFGNKANEETSTPRTSKNELVQLDKDIDTSSTDDTVLVSHSTQKWGLVGKVTCESIFKVQLFDAPEEVGYDDCSTGEIDGESEGVPCLFRPVSSSYYGASSGSRALAATEGSTVETVNTSPLTRENSTAGADSAETSTLSPEPGAHEAISSGKVRSGTGGTPDGTQVLTDGKSDHTHSARLHVGHRNTFLSVIYEDYVLFEVKLAPPGELSNLENLSDNWKSTATVSITEIVPVRTLI